MCKENDSQNVCNTALEGLPGARIRWCDDSRISWNIYMMKNNLTKPSFIVGEHLERVMKDPYVNLWIADKKHHDTLKKRLSGRMQEDLRNFLLNSAFYNKKEGKFVPSRRGLQGWDDQRTRDVVLEERNSVMKGKPATGTAQTPGEGSPQAGVPPESEASWPGGRPESRAPSVVTTEKDEPDVDHPMTGTGELVHISRNQEEQQHPQPGGAPVSDVEQLMAQIAKVVHMSKEPEQQHPQPGGAPEPSPATAAPGEPKTTWGPHQPLRPSAHGTSLTRFPSPHPHGPSASAGGATRDGRAYEKFKSTADTLSAQILALSEKRDKLLSEANETTREVEGLMMRFHIANTEYLAGSQG